VGAKGKIASVLVIAGVCFALFLAHEDSEHAPTTTTTAAFECDVISAQEAARCVGRDATVDFVVQRTYTDSAGTQFLDSSPTYQYGFEAVIHTSDLGILDNVCNPVADCYFEEVQVDGPVTEFNGQVEIVDPDDIYILPPPSGVTP
jgi:hypothetical protein